MSSQLSKALVVPEYKDKLNNTGQPIINSGKKIRLYTNNPANGTAIENVRYTVNVQSILDDLFPGQGRTAGPNACMLWGNDLYFSNSTANSQAVIRLPNYLNLPSQSIAEAHVVTLVANDYVGLAFDTSGQLFVAEGGWGNNQIVKYQVNTVVPASQRSNNNFISRVELGNAGLTSYFANLVFDTGGNLWVSDYRNNRVVSFVNGYNVNIKVFNDPNPSAGELLNHPEGLDFDTEGNLWIANNNDGNGLPRQNPTKIIKLKRQHLQDVINNGAAPSLIPGATCDVYADVGQPKFGGLQIDQAKNRIFVTEQVSKKGRYYDIDATGAIQTALSQPLSIDTSDPGNGGLTLLRQSHTANDPIEYDLYIQDTSAATAANTDSGQEPNEITGVAHAWESLDLWTTSQPQGMVHETLLGGSSGYVRVRVRNRSNFAYQPPAANSQRKKEQLSLYWAKASSSLSWPAPWNAGNKYGGDIINLPVPTQDIPAVPAMGEEVLTFAFNAPNPADYQTEFGTDSGHFCLLARIHRPGAPADGMTFPEALGTGATDLINNVLNNKRIAWRNVAIAATQTRLMPLGDGWLTPVTGFVGSNHGPHPFKTAFSIEIQDAQGQRIRQPEIRPVLSLSRSMVQMLRKQHIDVRDLGLVPIESHKTFARTHASLEDENMLFGIDDPTRCLHGLPLEAGQPFFASLHLWAPTPLTGLIVRLLQFADEGSGLALIGGQTVALGDTHMSRTEKTSACPCLRHCLCSCRCCR